MKLPVPPPDITPIISDVIRAGTTDAKVHQILLGGFGPAPGLKYRHWDNLRHLTPPAGFTSLEYWTAIKLARKPLYRPLPLKDKTGRPFQFGVPPIALELLHHVDRDAGRMIGAPEPVTNAQTQATYLLKSIIEEAITSSQLEGASTTRRVAKDMLLAGRAPQNRSERMIVNNFNAMQYVRRVKHEPLTPNLVLNLQRILTEATLDEVDGAGRLRRADEHIVVSDEIGTILHNPPSARELEERLTLMCDFANGSGAKEFLHPVLRAILVHFWLAYDHPFVDGNGRTARALFYWVMAREGYWLCEYVSISRILKKARAQYARSFLYTETDENDATYFILYQLSVLTRAIKDLHEYLNRKSMEMREAESALRRAGDLRAALNHRQLDLLSHAIKYPTSEFTIDSHRTAHDIAYATARSDLIEMAERKLLEQRKRGRQLLYVVPADLHTRLGTKPV